MTRSSAKAQSSQSRARLVLPFFLCGVIIAGVGVVLKLAGPDTVSAAAVRTEVADIVAEHGFMGPFQVQSDDYDPATQTFTGFLAETDNLMVGADRAVLSVNPSTDTISLELFNVAIVRVPDDDSESSVAHEERYILGPFPYTKDIVPGSDD